jgi:hypothetical protein
LVQPLAPALLQALLDRAIPLGSLSLDPLPLQPLGALPLVPLALEALRDRLMTPAERNYAGIAAAEPPRGYLPPARSLIGDSIVPGEPHAAGV